MALRIWCRAPHRQRFSSEKSLPRGKSTAFSL
jgi:hypothetical protein